MSYEQFILLLHENEVEQSHLYIKLIDDIFNNIISSLLESKKNNIKIN